MIRVEAMPMVEEGFQFIENHQFVDYEEEDIQRLNQVEREKIEGKPQIAGIIKKICIGGSITRKFLQF
jgi:hypothetical protein